jgi:SNF2 family DNA or RNA helicase
MKFEPRPWQKPMMSHLLDKRRCNLWAPMGSGKTSAVLTALDVLRFTGGNFFPVLVLAPLRVARGVWPAEIRQFDHLQDLRVSPIVGDADQRLRALKVGADVYTMNYENLPWLVEKGFPFRTVIADESTRLKNFRLRAGGIRAAALAQVARKTDRWINLTGTPSPNGLKDLWGQQWFVDFGQRLGNTWTSFKDRWFDYNQYTMEVAPKAFAESEIIGRLKDCTLSIDMKDYIKLQDPISNTVYVELPEKCRKQYKELEKQMFTQLACGAEINAQTAATLTTKCMQFAAGAVYHGDGKSYAIVHDQKLEALESIVEETAGANLVVCYWFRHDAERILKRFKHARRLESAQDVQDWNEGRIPMFLVHPLSAGHGLNLQHGGHHMVHYTKWWSLEAYAQVNERIGPLRQLQSGFERPVYHYHITVGGTVDELVAERLETKANIQDILLKAMKGRAA